MRIDDVVKKVMHAGGVITLPPSVLTLGGRQYPTGALTRTISADLTMAANTLHFVYAQILGGIPVLRISIQIPSVYVALNPTAKLVGAFYSTGHVSPVFGTFVTIEGAPISGPWHGGLTQLSQNGGGAITKGGTIDSDEVIFSRSGKDIRVVWSHAKSGAGGSAPGGNWEYNTAAVFPTHDDYFTGITQEDTCNAVASITTPTDGRNLVMLYNNLNKWVFRYTTPSNTIASNTTHPYAANTFRIGGQFVYPVLAWSETPLKDL